MGQLGYKMDKIGEDKYAQSDLGKLLGAQKSISEASKRAIDINKSAATPNHVENMKSTVVNERNL